jgi:transposase
MRISWLNVATIKAVSEQMKISWDEDTGVPLESWERAVKLRLARRESRPLEDLAVDETSFQKRHEYVTVLTDRNSGTILEILNYRKIATLKEWLEENQERLQAVRLISMDIWETLINAVRETIEGAEEKICFDRFHIGAYF